MGGRKAWPPVAFRSDLAGRLDGNMFGVGPTNGLCCEGIIGPDSGRCRVLLICSCAMTGCDG